MHILLIHQAFASLDEPGGTRHHEMARFLVARGHRVTVIASPVSYLTGESTSSRLPGAESQGSDLGSGIRAEPGITVLRAYTYPALHRSFVHRVFSFFSFMASSFFIGLGVKGVDLVWGTSPPIFQGATAWALARLRRVPFLFEVRDLWPEFAIAVGVLRNRILIRASKWLERFLYQHADQVVVNSPGFIDHVRRLGARHVVLVPNGSDTAMFDPLADGSGFRKKHGLEGKFLALYAGAHGMSNDLGVVLEAAGLLRGQADIAVVLLGDGKEKPALLSKAQVMGLANIHFLGSVPKTEMPQALAAADACIAILKPIEQYKTVYPNKVFDYMAAGRPVVLAIDGVIRQVVEKAGAGLSVPPGDASALAEAIRSLAADPPKGRSMGLAGRRCVEESFNRVQLAEKLAAIMEGMVGTKTR